MTAVAAGILTACGGGGSGNGSDSGPTAGAVAVSPDSGETGSKAQIAAAGAAAADAGAAHREPYDLAITASTATSTALRWSSDGTGVFGFGVERRPAGGGNWAQIAYLRGETARSHTDTQVQAGTAYEYRVVTYRRGSPASGYASASSVTTADNVAANPTPVTPVSGSGTTTTPTTTVIDGATIGNFPPAERDAALAEGLQIWRQQRIDINGINKGACASCHSADGVELALWKFRDEDIVRRGHIDGVPADGQQKLVKYFAALRQKYKVTTLRDVATDHPFQPGGSWYTGTVNERDWKFANESLAKEMPTLAGAPITTVEQARQAVIEARATNPLKVKIGIEMPAISKDCFRTGPECSLNDWMADLPRFPKPDKEAQWFALNDAYIANPTDENLRKILLAVDTMTTPWLNPGETATGPAGYFGTLKFNSLQVLQHFLRRQQLGLLADANPINAVNGPGIERANVPFVVGDWAFDKIPGSLIFNRTAQMPVFVRKSIGETTDAALNDSITTTQKNSMHTPWWWVGFLFDPGLGSGTGSEYFVSTLSNPDTDGYAFHQFYATARNAVHEEYRAKRGWDTSATRLPSGSMAIGEGGDSAMLFTTAEARIRHRQMEVNWARMLTLLLVDKLRQFGPSALSAQWLESSGFVCNDKNWLGLPGMVTRAASLDGTSAPLLFSTYNEIRTLAGCPTLLRPANYVASNGTGLKVEWFTAMNINNGSVGNKLGERVEPILQNARQDYGRGYFRDYLASIGAQGNAASRSTGFVVAPITGDYVFAEGTLSQARLWVDGKLVYNSEGNVQGAGGGLQVNPGVTVRLQAGQRVPIKLERYNSAHNGMAISWGLANGTLPLHAVPTSQLAPN